MLAHHWGLKTIYYSLIDKQGAKAAAEETPLMSIIEDEEEVCEACTL